MESVASNSPENHRRNLPFRPTQPIADRIVRALRHHLLLLHRSESNFFVLGATGNVYTVTLATTPSCTCPDQTTPCKHILFVLIRVLGVPHDDGCLRRRTLRTCEVNRLLGSPSLPGVLAGDGVRRRFHEVFSQAAEGTSQANVEIEEGTNCPICMDEMKTGEKVVACEICRNPIHEECLLRWRRSRGRRGGSCVICRARWRRDEERYLNLAAYVSDDGTADDGGVPCGG